MAAALAYFMSNYFHQDFDQEFGDEWGAVDAFIRADPHLAPAVPADIDQLLATHTDEATLDSYLSNLGCEYRADPEDGGYRGWLTEVARRVREATT